MRRLGRDQEYTIDPIILKDSLVNSTAVWRSLTVAVGDSTGELPGEAITWRWYSHRKTRGKKATSPFSSKPGSINGSASLIRVKSGADGWPGTERLSPGPRLFNFRSASLAATANAVHLHQSGHDGRGVAISWTNWCTALPNMKAIHDCNARLSVIREHLFCDWSCQSQAKGKWSLPLIW